MSATRTFKDGKGIVRKNGEEWLITFEDTETHIPDVYERVGLPEIQSQTSVFSICSSKGCWRGEHQHVDQQAILRHS